LGPRGAFAPGSGRFAQNPAGDMPRQPDRHRGASDLAGLGPEGVSCPGAGRGHRCRPFFAGERGRAASTPKPGRPGKTGRFTWGGRAEFFHAPVDQPGGGVGTPLSVEAVAHAHNTGAVGRNPWGVSCGSGGAVPGTAGLGDRGVIRNPSGGMVRAGPARRGPAVSGQWPRVASGDAPKPPTKGHGATGQTDGLGTRSTVGSWEPNRPTGVRAEKKKTRGRPPRTPGGTSHKGWLARVLRNVAANDCFFFFCLFLFFFFCFVFFIFFFFFFFFFFFLFCFFFFFFFCFFFWAQGDAVLTGKTCRKKPVAFGPIGRNRRRFSVEGHGSVGGPAGNRRGKGSNCSRTFDGCCPPPGGGPCIAVHHSWGAGSVAARRPSGAGGDGGPPPPAFPVGKTGFANRFPQHGGGGKQRGAVGMGPLIVSRGKPAKSFQTTGGARGRAGETPRDLNPTTGDLISAADKGFQRGPQPQGGRSGKRTRRPLSTAVRVNNPRRGGPTRRYPQGGGGNFRGTGPGRCQPQPANKWWASGRLKNQQGRGRKKKSHSRGRPTKQWGASRTSLGHSGKHGLSGPTICSHCNIPSRRGLVGGTNILREKNNLGGRRVQIGAGFLHGGKRANPFDLGKSTGYGGQWGAGRHVGDRRTLHQPTGDSRFTPSFRGDDI